jgi:hypothetical protein
MLLLRWLPRPRVKKLNQKIMTRSSTCPLLLSVRVPSRLSPFHHMQTRHVDPPCAPHFDVPDYKLMGIQLFDMMHSFPKDDATDRFYAAEKENIDDARLLEASGFNASPSQWNFFELAEDGKLTYLTLYISRLIEL